MSGLLPFVVAGLVTGSLYGLAASGLVLTYKTSGIFNFAHGAVGAAAAYVFFELRDRQGVPWVAALLVVLLAMAPLCGLLLSYIAGRLAAASTVRRVVATIGVLLLVQGIIQLRYGLVPLSFASPFPTATFGVFGTRVGIDQVCTAAIALAMLGGLFFVFARTRVGLNMRAVVDNPELLDLAGGVPRRVRAVSWTIGAAFACMSGILFAPTVGLDSVLLTLLVVQAFGAAAIGRFDRLGVTFVGGLAIGVGQALLRAPDIQHVAPFLRSLTGLDQSVSFLVLFGLLLATRGRTGSEGQLRAPAASHTLPLGANLAMGLPALTIVMLLPTLLPSKAPVLTLGAVFVTIFAALFLLVEVSGQVSLCHTTFVAVGATAFSHFQFDAGLPWLLAVLLAAAVTLPVGALVAVPAIRLSGVFLALCTLGFGVLVEQMVYNRGLMFGALGRRAGRRPAVLGLDGDAGYYYLCVAVAVVAILLVVAIRRSRLGRLLKALADSPLALATHGSNTNVTRVLVFCIAAAMAAVGGALYVGVVGSVSSAGVSPVALGSFNSLLWLAALSVAGRHAVVSPVLAAAALAVLPSFVAQPLFAQYLTIGFGLSSVVVALYAEEAGRWLAAQRSAGAARLTHSPVADRLRRVEVVRA